MIGEFLEENENKNEKMLKDQLKKTWIELDKMLFCTKLPMCVIKSVHMHSKSNKTNVTTTYFRISSVRYYKAY